MNERLLKGSTPTWNDFARHPNLDALWKRQAMAGYLDRVAVPALHVAGWWDQGDFYGPATAPRRRGPGLARGARVRGGSNGWKRCDAWPLKAAVSPRSLYLREAGALA